MRHHQVPQWKNKKPIFCRKACHRFSRRVCCPQPASPHRLLASPVLLKVPSGIMSWFKSYLTCCSVLIFWVSIMLWGWGFFPLCDICILSCHFILFSSALQSHTVHFYSSADVTRSNLLFCLLHCSIYSDQLFLFSNVCPTALWTKSKQ